MITLILAVALLAAPAGDAADETMETESPLSALPAALQEAIGRFYAAIENGDVEARIELLDDDIIMMPNHWTMSRGVETMAEMFRMTEGTVFRLRDREVVDAGFDGDLAYTVNSYYYTWHDEGEEPQWHKTKNVHVWRKHEDGRWLQCLDIWNSDVPMAQFSEE